MPQDDPGYIHVDENMKPLGRGITAKRTITEETLWEAQAADGGIFRKTVERLKLTNLRAIRGGQSVMLEDCDSIAAVNVRTKSGRTVGDVQLSGRAGPSSSLNKSATLTALRLWPAPTGKRAFDNQAG